MSNISDISFAEFLATGEQFKLLMLEMKDWLYFYEELKKDITSQIDDINPHRGGATLTDFEIVGDGINISAQSEDYFHGESDYKDIIRNFKISFEDIQNRKAGERIKEHLDAIKAKEAAAQLKRTEELKAHQAAAHLANEKATYERLKAKFEGPQPTVEPNR